MVTRVPISVLDLATVREGHSSADALRGTIEIAKTADDLGYARFWVAEHHNMPAVASTSPAVLIGAVAANTRTIRVGSGGVMLPNHMPFVVAEQFAILEALYPDRIDLGIGRAPGTDQVTAAALRGVSPYLTVEQFPEHLQTVLALLGDERIDLPEAARLHATPAPETFPEVWMLGSSTYGAQVAAALGLPFCYAYHFAISSDVDAALHLYRSGFKPSPRYAEPHAMVSASVIAAETTEEAQFLAGPSRIVALRLRTGRLGGDLIGDVEYHGGNDQAVNDQAVYAYAREDLDWWETQLPRPQHLDRRRLPHLHARARVAGPPARRRGPAPRHASRDREPPPVTSASGSVLPGQAQDEQ